MANKQNPIEPDSDDETNSVVDAIFCALSPHFDPVIAISNADPQLRKLTNNPLLGPVTLTAEQFSIVVATVAKAGFNDAAGQFSHLIEALGLGKFTERVSDNVTDVDLSTVRPAGAA